MKIRNLHSWEISPKEAIALQKELRSKVMRRPTFDRVRTVAGADIAIDTKRGDGIAAVIIYSYPDLEELEVVTSRIPIKYPYIPGLLSFREGPVLLDAFRKVSIVPDVILFDAQGIAHPRGLGLASHMGLWLDVPSIGCAKSRLCGEHAEPGKEVGDWAPLTLLSEKSTASRRDDVIGAVLRTRKDVKPIYVSLGHRIDLKRSIEIVLGCLDRTRIPKPTREADHLVGKIKRKV